MAVVAAVTPVALVAEAAAVAAAVDHFVLSTSGRLLPPESSGKRKSRRTLIRW